MRNNEVWEFHLALMAAEGHERFYLPSEQLIADIRMDSENNEGELALDSILAIARPSLPQSLRERAYQVSRLLAFDLSDEEVVAYVDAWLEWDPDSGKPPPYLT